MIAFTPADPASARDRRATEHADYLFNRLYLNAVVKGREDLDVDGRVTPGERHPERAGKADFIGLNYYFRSRVTGLGDSISERIKLLDFLPQNSYAHAGEPDAPALPHHVHRLRLGGLPRGLPALAQDGGQLWPAGLRDRERAGRRDDGMRTRATSCRT